MAHWYEEQRKLILAALRVLSADYGRAEDPPDDREHADDLLEQAAKDYVRAVQERRRTDGF